METSPGFNVDYEIIPGAHRLKGIVRSITKRVVFLPPSEGYPSEYPKHPERGAAAMLDAALDQAPQLPFPGEIGSVPTRATLLDEANAIIN
jgi:hypothetical protein